MPEQAKISSHIEAIANAMPDPIFVMSKTGVYLDIIGGKDRALYADGESLIGKSYTDVLPEKMAERFTKTVQKAIKTGRLQELEYQLADSDVNGIDSQTTQDGQWYEARVYPLDASIYNTPAVVWLAINITSRKHMEEQIEHMSSNDPLTDLYNRDYFLGLVEEEVNRARLNNRPLSLAKINLDCFKRITDAYGHEAGDRAILTAAHAIQNVIGDLGYIGRLSCDQFMFVLPEVKAVDAFRITKLAQESITSQTIRLEDGETTCLTSHAGVTELRNEADDSQVLFKRTNQAIQALEGTRETTKTM